MGEGGADTRLAIGISRTRSILPEEIGRPVQASLVASAVVEATRDAGIEDPRDVHYVQVKGPLLTPGRIADADARGVEVTRSPVNASRPASRLASKPNSHIQRASVCIENTFLHGLRQGRMRKDRVGEVPLSCRVIHCHDEAVDELRHLGSDHVSTDQLPRLIVKDGLDQPLIFSERDGLAVGREGEPADTNIPVPRSAALPVMTLRKCTPTSPSAESLQSLNCTNTPAPPG